MLTATSADGQRWSEPAVLFPNVSSAQTKSLSRYKMHDGSVLEEPFWETGEPPTAPHPPVVRSAATRLVAAA